MKSVVLLILFLSSSVEARWQVGNEDIQPRQKINNSRTAQNISNFWQTHKADLSLSINGALGTFGTGIGFHFHPMWSGQLGFGGSSHYQSYGIRVKRLFLVSSPLTPYVSGGLSRWQRTRGGPFKSSEVSPQLLVRSLMSEDDRKNSRIDEKLLNASFGLQYVFDQGSWKGFGFNVEGLFLLDIEEWVSAPTVSVGASYFF